MGVAILRISVAMTTYNGERFLMAQMESFEAQILKPHELIIHDDVSSDRTMKLLQNFAARAPFTVKVFQNETRLGYSRNFERALAACSGDIIFLSDQDDVWFPEKIRTVMDIFETSPDLQCVVNDLELTDGDLRPIGATQLSLIRRQGASDRTMVAGCGTAIRKNWRDLVLPFPQFLIPHDSWIHDLAQRLDTVCILPVCLQYWRRHGANSSNSLYSSPKQSRWPFHPYLGKWLKGEAPHNFVDAKKALQLLRDRLELTRQKEYSFIDQATLHRALETVDREIRLVDDRAKILSLPIYWRIAPILSLLLSGKYRAASGVLSALKDLVGRRLVSSQ